MDNYAVGVRDKLGNFIKNNLWATEPEYRKTFKIILTIAHLDHDEENHDVKDDRLKALCQRCHLRYDVEEKKRRAKKKKAVGDLFV